MAAVVVAACAAGSFGPAPSLPAAASHGVRPAQAAGAANSPRGTIRHIVIAIQENRSFNNLFYGFPGAKTSRYGYDSDNNRVALAAVALEAGWDVDHSSASFFAACNGTGSIPGTDCRMNGFNHETVTCGGRFAPPCPNKEPQYAYVPHSETKPYFDMGKQYVVADRMYASNFDASSFISHQYIIAGQANGAVDFPFGEWGCPGGPGDDINTVGPERQVPYGQEAVCSDPTTLADELDNAGISWAYYTSSIDQQDGIWSAYQAIKHIYQGKDWTKDVITPQKRFFTDVSHGKLRAVNWITPTCANSDHAGCTSNTGPSWIASIVNAVGESPYWKSTAVFVFWDDYGGWYDSEPPAYVDYDGLGLRVPLVIVSPYAKKGRVSHVHYEHGSILKFVEDAFGLPRMAASDTRATSPAADCFDFGKPPRRFVPIQSPYDETYFQKQTDDRRLPDWE